MSTGLQGALRQIRSLVRRKNKRRANRGFSLLETLTALTVLSLTMSALMDVYTTGLKGAGASERKTRANILAQSLLTETLSRPAQIASTSSGNFETFKWQIITVLIDKMQTGQGKSLKKWGLFQINISVALNNQKLVSLQKIKMGRLND